MKILINLYLLLLIVAPVFAEQEVNIGVMLCLTGECAEWGNNALKGIRLATKELNARSGIMGRKVVLTVEDTREGAGGTNSIAAYQNLILNPKINFIIGPTWSIGGAPLAPIIAKNKNVIVTSPSLGIGDFNETAENIFNVWPHDSYATEELAKYAISKGWKAGIIFEANDLWGVVQADTFENKFIELGGTIVKRISNTPDSTSFKTEALAVKKLKPDFVFNANLFKLSLFAKELNRLNYQGNSLTILVDETRLKEAQGALEGTIYARYPDSVGTFVKNYLSEYGEKPGVAADTGYDTVNIYAAAIMKLKSFDLELVSKEILQTEISGASGRIIFDDQGGVVKNPSIYQIKAGEEVKVMWP